jgi:hypothetical protein
MVDWTGAMNLSCWVDVAAGMQHIPLCRPMTFWNSFHSTVIFVYMMT